MRVAPVRTECDYCKMHRAPKLLPVQTAVHHHYADNSTVAFEVVNHTFARKESLRCQYIRRMTTSKHLPHPPISSTLARLDSRNRNALFQMPTKDGTSPGFTPWNTSGLIVFAPYPLAAGQRRIADPNWPIVPLCPWLNNFQAGLEKRAFRGAFSFRSI